MEARTGWIIGISALLIVGGGSAAFYFIYWKPKKEAEKLLGGSSVPSGGNSGNENTSSGGGGLASADYDAMAAQVNKKISTGAVDSATMKLIQQLLANGYERKGNKIVKKGSETTSSPKGKTVFSKYDATSIYDGKTFKEGYKKNKGEFVGSYVSLLDNGLIEARNTSGQKVYIHKNAADIK